MRQEKLACGGVDFVGDDEGSCQLAPIFPKKWAGLLSQSEKWRGKGNGRFAE